MINVYSVEERQVLLEDGTSMKLNYYITEEITKAYQYPLYGIRIVKDILGVSEQEETGPISSERDYTVDLCRKLARNTVTPLTLLEIIDDLISDIA